MINPEELRAGPDESKKSLPVLTEEEVRRALIANIESASAYTKQIRRFGESNQDAKKTITIFDMRASERLSIVYNPKEAIGKFERQRFQELAFAVMTTYGLNPDISKPEWTSGGFDAQGISRHRDGTSRQFLDYPSQTIPGLYFERWTDFYTDGAPIYVRWAVIGQKRPFREHLRNLFPKPVRIEI